MQSAKCRFKIDVASAFSLVLDYDRFNHECLSFTRISIVACVSIELGPVGCVVFTPVCFCCCGGRHFRPNFGRISSGVLFVRLSSGFTFCDNWRQSSEVTLLTRCRIAQWSQSLKCHFHRLSRKLLK